MVRRHGILWCLVLAVLLLMSSPLSAESGSTKKLWDSYIEAQKKGLPKSAIAALQEIEKTAVRENRPGEALKALCLRIVAESNIAGNKPEVKVIRLKDEIAKAPPSMKPLMQSILAQWYWHYYSRNKWRFMNRTETAGLDDKDFTTWDLPKLFKEISSIYQDLLTKGDVLKKTTLAEVKDVIDPGNVPPAIRPTLYDVVAHSALEFYMSGEQAGALPEDAFEIDASSPALESADRFLAWKPETTDTASPKYRALLIFQELLRFHRGDGSPDAFIDADLLRLHYAYNSSVGEKKDERYQAALEDITAKYPSSELASLALYHKANLLYKKGKYTAAYSAADKGRTMHPKSYGAALCLSLIETITAKSLSLTTERTVPPKIKSQVLINYANITGVTFKIVKDNWQSYLETRKNPMGREETEALLARPAVAQWTIKLKPTEDYRAKKVKVDIPALEPGFYRIFASHRSDFSKNDNMLQQAIIQVSTLGVVTQKIDDTVRGIITDSMSGEPIQGATVSLYWLKDYNAPRYEVRDTQKTDENGCYSFKAARSGNYRGIRLYAKDGKGSEYIDLSDLYPYERGADAAYTRTVFFTDRAIYRPGQTVHFKGVLINVDKQQKNYQVIPNRNVTVRFLDHNSQEISTLNLTSNDFGSVQGSFAAPADRLTGTMSLQTHDPSGSVSFRVEEYKRPKFSVEIVMPKESLRLGDKVTVSGSAMGYTGAPVDGAKVSYRVVRQVQMPYWWYFFWSRGRYGAIGESREIAHGKAATDASGKFSISFVADPDRSVPKEEEPSFVYQVYADVTDSAGETRSDDASVRIGYTTMEARMSAGNWQTEGTPVKMTVSTTTLDGVPVGAEGLVQVYRLKEPPKAVRKDMLGGGQLMSDEGEILENDSESAEAVRWPLGDVAEKGSFTTGGKEPAALNFNLKAGAYRAILSSKDRYGNAVKAELPLTVVNLKSSDFTVKVPSYYVAQSSVVDTGGTFRALWGTGYGQGRAFIEMFRNGRSLKKFWTGSSATQSLIEFPVSDDLRGGFTVVTTYVRENRYYSYRSEVIVPWSNKKLEVSIETFRSKLTPGQNETWSLRVKGPGAEKKAAELVAALYDESLDAFAPHFWQTFQSLFASNYLVMEQRFSDAAESFQAWHSSWNPRHGVPSRVYPDFLGAITENLFGYGYMNQTGAVYKRSMATCDDVAPCESAAPAPPPAAKPAAKEKGEAEEGLAAKNGRKKADGDTEAENRAGGGGKKPAVDLKDVKARKNLNETAFFFPCLLADKDGSYKITFTIPEALTKWHFMALAHGKGLESGFTENHTVTQKDLMVQPNPPRFMREGDELEFAVKVTNMTEQELKGAVALSLFDPATSQPLDEKLGITKADKEIAVPPKQSKSYYFRLSVPDNITLVAFKAVAKAGAQSDGEEGIIPVLSRRIAVTESIPLWVRGPGERKFTFEKLAKSGGSDSLINRSYTVQMTSNPAWYAVQALPFLMEFPHECSEQVFNRLYANALAQKIASSDPKIRKVFDEWRTISPEALLSNLEKNAELKGVMLMETPWVLQAKSESQAKRNVGILFEDGRMKKELSSAYDKLRNMQLSDGSWPWFPGGYPNSYITLYIVTGFGRLKHLGVQASGHDLAVRALDSLDRWIVDVYREILKQGRKDDNHLSVTIALYLYGRSFYLAEKPVPAFAKEALDYFLGQARKYWLRLDCRMGQGYLAIALKRFGDKKTSHDIMASIRERSVTDEELGMYWAEGELSWWWYRAPIEAQALMIEAFDEIMGDAKAVEECKVWLLKQKQTQDWKTTKATADAVYGLLCRGDNLLASSEIVEVDLGGVKLDPEKVEAGTGFYEKRYDGPQVKPSMGQIEVKKKDKGIAWGGAYWQYMEDMAKITPHVQNPLKLEKSVFVVKRTGSGPVIEPVKGSLEVGDLLRIRIVLRTDRDMEYVHMADQRGSGLEPVNVLSRYKYQDGLRYYESTRDTATHFYIDYLPKGTYVFEYDLRVQLRGAYQNGMATIQCMYAPEFSSHSESVKLEVK
ncbi:MAG: alpha-2-macroglobulin family protein [Candidatus Eremiobacteraeota bacterium]|nr:alpha-2-macroglobulin family protein [Candidatus Eremiobacteraeota bacterium]